METKEFIRITLEGLSHSLEPVLKGLTPAEIAWQPAPNLNPIGLILFHTARSEDFFIQELVQRQPQVWEREQWYVRFNFPKEERGRHYKAEQVNAFISPDIDNMRNYFTAVREGTLKCLDGLKPEDFHRVVTTPRGERTVAEFFSNIASHAAQHLGEMSYLRGLQRGLNK
jgi:hypothetical protein